VAEFWTLGITDVHYRKFIAVLLFAAMLAGCGGFGFAYEKQLSGKYGLVAVDVLDQMSVSETLPSGSAVGIINQTVFAVGWDEHFIIAKQHPNDASHHMDKSVTKYYILRVLDGALTGPLDESEFDIQRDKLGVSKSLSFTLVFDNLK
jgi:hypothetical protein